MNRRSDTIALLATLAAVIAIGPANAADDAPDTAGIAEAVKAVMQANLEATQAEDEAAVVATMHPRSPIVGPTRQALAQVFRAYDLKYEMLEPSFVGTSGEYAILRMKQRTTKVAGPAFRNNTIDTLQVFRKSGDEWKLWQSTVLEINFDD